MYSLRERQSMSLSPIARRAELDLTVAVNTIESFA